MRVKLHLIDGDTLHLDMTEPGVADLLDGWKSGLALTEGVATIVAAAAHDGDSVWHIPAEAVVWMEVLTDDEKEPGPLARIVAAVRKVLPL